MGKYEPKEMSPLERLRDQAGFWAYSGRDIKSQRRENNLAIAKGCYEKALALYRRIGAEYPSIRSQLDIRDTLEAYMELCRRINTREAMQEARMAMEEALNIITGCLAQVPDDKQLVYKQVDTLYLLGGICRDLGGRRNLLAARRYFEQGIEACDRFVTEIFDPKSWRRMAHGLEQFATMNRALYGAEAAETARECLQAAVKLRIRLFRKNFVLSAISLAKAYAWLGDACRDLGGSENLKAARHNYEMARRIWSVVDQRGGPVHFSIAHIGVLYRMGMLPGTAKEKAWQYLTQAAEIAELVSTAKGFAQWKQYSQLLLRLRNRL